MANILLLHLSELMDGELLMGGRLACAELTISGLVYALVISYYWCAELTTWDLRGNHIQVKTRHAIPCRAAPWYDAKPEWAAARQQA